MNTNILYFLISYLATGLILLGISIFVYLKDRKNKLNIIFSLYSLSIAWWSLFSIPMIVANDMTIALFWDRICLIGTIFIPTFFIHFIFTYIRIEQKYKYLIRIFYIISFLFLATDMSPYFVKTMEMKNYIKYFTSPGIFYYIFVCYFGIAATLGIVLIFNAYKKALQDSLEKTRLSYLFWANVFGYAGGSLNYLLVFNLCSSNIVILGNYLTTLYSLAIAYIIFRYRFLDIEVFIKRTIIFAGLSSFIFSTVFVTTFLIRDILGKYININQDVSTIFSIVIIVLLYEPIKQSLINLTDRFLFQKEYDHQAILKEISRGMVGKVELEELSGFISAGMSEKMKLENSSIVTRDDYNVALLTDWHRDNKRLVLYDEIGHFSKNKKYNSQQLKDKMRQLKAAVSAPIFLKDDIFWLLLLGNKKSGKTYTREDVNMLEALSDEISIAIENAVNFQELQRSQMELLRQENLKFVSVLVKGLAHEIFNPLTPLMHKIEDLEGEDLVKLFELFENNKANLGKGEELKFRDSFLALRESTKSLKTNAKHIQLIVDTLSKIEKGDDKTIGPLDIKTFLKEAVTVFGLELDPSLQQGVVISQDVERNLPPVKGNPTLLKQVFINLYKNACEAMKNSATKKIDISCRIGGLNRNELLIEFSDTGSGIAPAALSKIFTYGFTTKGSRGSGIGLNQCKAIIEKLGGFIKIEPKKDNGAKFIISLPIWAEKREELKNVS